MYDWLITGRSGSNDARGQASAHRSAAVAQKLDIHIPWLTALAMFIVMGTGLCIAGSLIGAAVLQALR